MDTAGSHGLHFLCSFQGDPGIPGFKGEAGPKGELVSGRITQRFTEYKTNVVFPFSDGGIVV